MKTVRIDNDDLEVIAFMQNLGFSTFTVDESKDVVGTGVFRLGNEWNVTASLRYKDILLLIFIDKRVVWAGQVLDLLADNRTNGSDMREFIRDALIKSLDETKVSKDEDSNL